MNRKPGRPTTKSRVICRSFLLLTFTLPGQGGGCAQVTAARIEFAAFYADASDFDAALMDALVMMRRPLAEFSNLSRDHLRSLRPGVERTSDAVEHVFTGLREMVRASVTFRRLNDAERSRIERLVFDMPPV